MNAETGIYEKLEMLRCRLKRRARPDAKRRGTPLKSKPYSLTSNNYTKQIGVGNEDKIAVKVDSKVVLQEREKFASDLLKKITRTTNGETIAYNVETNIYRTVLNDYMGETGVVSQIFNAELQQRGAEQKQQWNLKEQEFYDLKSDWIQNVSYLKQTGTKRWENMVQEFQGKWKDWRADFKAEHEANQKIYLDRIESTLEKKEAWTTSFLQKSNEQADELTMKEMYDSIAGMVTSMQENLPAGVSLNVNVNDILSNILSKKPGSISASLIDRASSIDTNFFLNEVKKYNFNDSGLKEQFKGMLDTTNKLSQNLIILQTLESLRNLPESFAKTIQQQNGAVEEQLNQTMAYGGFARVGATYIRTIKTASGGDEVQTLGTYQYYNYNPPTVFPEVKDSNGKSWDLGKPELLIDREKVPSASDLTVMVRLAKNKMSADFEKVFNPKVQHNYEAEKGLFDPSEVQASFNDYLEGVRNGETVSCLGKSAEQCAKSAMNSGFLVGEVAEGSFGEAQFAQSYIILKTKKEMDKRKGKMDAARHRKQGGMGRFYNQLGAIGEGLGEAVKGAGSAILSAAKASLKATTDFNGAKKDLKEAGKQGERALQGALYATSGAVDFVMFASETFAEPFVTVFTLGMGNETMNGKFAEGNYELAKFRDTNKAQRHIDELGMRTGAEMYANDAVVDKVVTTTLAVTGIVGAILSFTPLAPIGVGLMAVSALGTAGWKTFRGAYEGGSAGMLAGAVSGIANSALDATTNGIVGVNLSYSYANGFGAGVSIGTDNKTELGGSIGLNYNSKSGAWGATAGLKVGLGGTDNQGNYSNWAEVGYNRNNIGRDNQSSGVSANIRGQYNEKQGLSGSLGLSYDTKAGYGATIGLTSGFGPVSVTPSWTVSEYGGFSSDVQYGVNKNLLGNIFEQATNPNHASANRNLLDDIWNGMGAVVSGIGAVGKSAWESAMGAVGGINGENLANGWNGIKNALFGGDDGGAVAKELDAISLYNAAMGEAACFVKGTKITTKTGLKFIENITADDMVYAFDETTKKLDYKKVLEVFRNKTNILVKIHLSNEAMIETTEGHPFYVKNKGFVFAKDLSQEDKLMDSKLKELGILEIIKVSVDDVQTYNFHVEDFHTYFVSDSQVLVHNTSIPEGNNPIEIIKQKLNNYYDKLSRGVKLTKQESDQLDRLEGAIGAGVYARHQNEKGEWVWTQIGEMKTPLTSYETSNESEGGRPNIRVLKDGDKIQTEHGELLVRVLDSKHAPITWIDPETGNAMIDGLGHRQFAFGPNGEEYSYKGTMNGTQAVRASAEYAANKPSFWNSLFNFGKPKKPNSWDPTPSVPPSSTGSY
ncbi:polymorphic toxin-type HINT domain-containing protein [Leptospira weilii]|nr:polymorphic toxin-type HINT domain-containing protein [Leptospira weilii]MDL5247499.1 polymorphic toxin-type HINT domain-containing protein [Leptospira weilii]